MIFYWSVLFLALGLYFYFILMKSKQQNRETIQLKKQWMIKNAKFIIIGAMLVITLITGILHNPLRKTLWCAYKGHEYSLETRRDWISGICSYQGPNNSWIPIERLLGIPGNDDAPTNIGH